MKDYILISNTTENKDRFLFGFISSQLKKLTNEKFSVKNLVLGKLMNGNYLQINITQN